MPSKTKTALAALFILGPVSYRVPEIVTRGRFPDGGESDSTWRTQESQPQMPWESQQPKRGRLWLADGSCIRLRPQQRNHVWSYDFVEDRTHDGRKYRMLNVLDEFSHECLAVRVARRLNDRCDRRSVRAVHLDHSAGADQCANIRDAGRAGLLHLTH